MGCRNKWLPLVIERGKIILMDSIVKEVREIREAYAKQFGYDLKAIHRDLKAQEQASGRQVVSLPPRRPKPVEQRASRNS